MSKASGSEALTLSASGLVKRYGAKTVVSGVEIEVSQGEIVGLLGPNGAGKTTSFYMIVGLVAADAGVVTIGGEDVSALPMYKRARMGLGYLPQESSVFRRLSAYDNVYSVLEALGVERGEAHKRAQMAMEELGITHIADRKAYLLSGGERRRVEIARALAVKPKFILLDEPFAGVDPIAVAEIRERILQLRSFGIGIILSDHNVRETLGVCQRAYIINEGSVLVSGAPDEIVEHPEARTKYLGEDFSLS